MVGLGYKLVRIMNLHSDSTEYMTQLKIRGMLLVLTRPSASELQASSLHHQPKSPHAQYHDAASSLEKKNILLHAIQYSICVPLGL